jgi:hypothetical protein
MFKKGWDWLVAPIKSEADAAKALSETSKLFYVYAALSAVGGAIFFYLGSESGDILLDVLFCLLGGYYLPRRKSRALAIFLLMYAAAVTALTFASRAGLYEGTGGKNIILTLFLLATAYRGVRGACAYHRTINTTILWKNVLIVWAVALFLGGVVYFVAVISIGVYEQISGPQLSEEAFGMWSGLVLAVTLTITFVLLTRRFPFASFPGGRYERQRTLAVDQTRL